MSNAKKLLRIPPSTFNTASHSGSRLTLGWKRGTQGIPEAEAAPPPASGTGGATEGRGQRKVGPGGQVAEVRSDRDRLVSDRLQTRPDTWDVGSLVDTVTSVKLS